MPKRDEAYMAAQRTAIARAALEVLLEKGLYDTSLRDICQAAGISIGALYIHFPTKEEAVVAACALDHEETKDAPPFADWDAYVAAYATELGQPLGRRQMKRFRLSMQYVAELSQMDRNPEGLSAIYHLFRNNIRRNLRHLQDRGEIDLTLGLEQTTEIHMQLIAGASYQIAADRELDPRGVAGALKTAMAMTAGLRREGPHRPPGRRHSPAQRRSAARE